MNIVPSLNSHRKTLLIVVSVFLLNSFSSAIFAQQSPADVDRRERYVLSSPNAVADVKPAATRFLGNSPVKVIDRVSKTLEPDDYEIESKAFALINQKRLDRGLVKLVWNNQAARLARQHSKNMAQNDFFSHAGLNGEMVDERATEFGATDWEAIGENIAFCQGFTNPAEFVVGRWMLSTGHRENILNRIWTESGIGMAKTSDGKYYFTQVFIVK